MAEEEKKEEKKEETKEEESGEDAAPAPASKVDEARDVLKKIEDANKVAKGWVDRAEALKAEAVISGEAEAGAEAPKVSKEDAIKARANEKLRGTGLNIE